MEKQQNLFNDRFACLFDKKRFREIENNHAVLFMGTRWKLSIIIINKDTVYFKITKKSGKFSTHVFFLLQFNFIVIVNKNYLFFLCWMDSHLIKHTHTQKNFSFLYVVARYILASLFVDETIEREKIMKLEDRFTEFQV